MSTTLLFVELLIAGIQVVVWLVLLVLCVFGYQWAAALPFTLLSEWQALIAVIVLSFVYVLGIFSTGWRICCLPNGTARSGERFIQTRRIPLG